MSAEVVTERMDINPIGADGKPKSAAQLKKEAAKAEKLAKFREKEKKMAQIKAAQANKSKEVSIYLVKLSINWLIQFMFKYNRSVSKGNYSISEKSI